MCQANDADDDKDDEKCDDVKQRGEQVGALTAVEITTVNHKQDLDDDDDDNDDDVEGDDSDDNGDDEV